MIRPTLSFNYSPSFSKEHWYKTQIDTTEKLYSFPEFEGSLYGFYGAEDFGGIGFGLDNNLEMKMKIKKRYNHEREKDPSDRWIWF